MPTKYGLQFSFGRPLFETKINLRRGHNSVFRVMTFVFHKSFFSLDADLDTQRSFFVESGRGTTRYLRILRVSFVKSFVGSPSAPRPLLRLSYVTFEPMIISTGGIIGIPIFETMAETMKRAMVWLNRNSEYTYTVSSPLYGHK